MDPLTLGLRVAVPVAALVGLLAVWWLDRPGGGWFGRVRSRLLMGVPWGTLVSAGFVLAVYLFVQGGIDDWRRPLTLPFYSWSYFYPLGVVFSPFTHTSSGHLVGNLLGTLALAPLAEYAWGHFPVERGRTAFSSWRTNPYVRAFVLFPLGVVGVGLLTTLLHWGPIVGFSGVVYAFAGFALVRYPLGTLVATLVQSVARTAYDALRNPVVEAEAQSVFQQPWFVDIGVQGHLAGFLLGVVLGAVIVSRRGGAERPSALRLWAGTALFASLLSPMWAIWWIRGPDEYVLHRAAGLAMILVLGTLVAAGVRASDREFALGVSRRTTGLLLLVLPLLVMATVAVPVNATLVSGPPDAGGSVSVGDYTVTYAEDVTRPKTQVLDLSVLGEQSEVTTGGVIVTSDERELWARSVSPGELSFYGRYGVDVGGLDWRETVVAERRGWSAEGGGTAYQVWLRPPDGPREHVFSSGPATADLTLAGRTVAVHPDDGEFVLGVSRENSTLARTPIPSPGENVTAGGLTFVRDGSDLVGTTDDGTRVPVASRENDG